MYSNVLCVFISLHQHWKITFYLQVSRGCLLCRATIPELSCLNQATRPTQDPPSTHTQAHTPTPLCCCTLRHMHTLRSRSFRKDWTYMHTSCGRGCGVREGKLLYECVSVCPCDMCVYGCVCVKTHTVHYLKKKDTLLWKFTFPTERHWPQCSCSTH